MDARPRVAVIGAGAAGLATLKALADAGVPAVCFEAADTVGGLWVYGAADSPAYRTLHLNTSRGRTEFADHPMPAHWPDYPDHTRIAGYLADYADRFGLLDAVRLRHTVDRVTRADDGGWTVHATGPDGPVERHRRGGGRRQRPQPGAQAARPRLPGRPAPPSSCTATTTGGPSSSPAGGCSSSAAATPPWTSPSTPRTPPSAPCCRCAAASGWCPSTCSAARRTPSTGRWPAGCPGGCGSGSARRMLAATVGRPARYGLPAPAPRLPPGPPHPVRRRCCPGSPTATSRPGPASPASTGERVEFTDGRVDEVDLVVWCTGYRVEIPFLDPDAARRRRRHRLPLYRHVFHLDAPGLAFVGLMQSTGAAFPLVEAQARLVAGRLAGTWAPPDAAAAAGRLPGRAAGRDRPLGAAPPGHAGGLRRVPGRAASGNWPPDSAGPRADARVAS